MTEVITIALTERELKDIIRKSVNEAMISFKEEVQQEDIITIQEAVKMLGITKATLAKWSKEGKIPQYGIGGRVYYKREDITRALIKIN